MRTKTLLIAVGALVAAGVISSTAAPVYSANIVGYVNQTFAPNGAYSLVTAPVLNTSTNAEVVLPSLQQGDNILLWNGSGFDVYTFEFAGFWFGPPSDTDNSAPSLMPGAAFFYQNNQGTSETNTYSGTVVLTNTLTLPPNGAYALDASTAPVGGSLESTNFNLPLQQGDNVLLWNGNGYDVYTFEFSGFWFGPPSDTDNSAPNISVAQGFFYQNNQGSSEVWTQSFIVQ
jgi:hypothetical protein